ncbi:MAG: RNA-binding domain-containing protein [Methanomassiliicoccales archaeon]
MSQITIRAQCHPTEDPEKVRKAILNLFPASEVVAGENCLLARTRSAERFKELLRELRILDTARGMMFKGVRDGLTVFSLNKQVALMGKVSFVEESVPLGSIEVVMEDDSVEELIDDLAPRTYQGEIA